MNISQKFVFCQMAQRFQIKITSKYFSRGSYVKTMSPILEFQSPKKTNTHKLFLVSHKERSGHVIKQKS